MGAVGHSCFTATLDFQRQDSEVSEDLHLSQKTMTTVQESNHSLNPSQFKQSERNPEETQQTVCKVDIGKAKFSFVSNPKK